MKDNNEFTSGSGRLHMRLDVTIALLCLAAVMRLPADVVATADFSKAKGPINAALHSSGWTPRSTSGALTQNPDVGIVKSMNFRYARTHDWALVNPGQRVVDYQFIFPLMHLDAKDPKNYYFAPTDHLLQMSRDTGLEIFYRLGTSIEHTGSKVHFNSLIPDDFEKVAEIFAGTVRHYNRGWANGKTWNIRYWEIWNEPSNSNSMWCMPGGDTPANAGERRAKFAEFFVVCLKRLKSEFPEIKVGGPALSWMDEAYFQFLLDSCKNANVKPDFISWHYYDNDPAGIAADSRRARAMCDRNGFAECELIVNEWHYKDSQWSDLRSANPAVSARVQNGPTGHNNIDSAAFTLGSLITFQTESALDLACFYGCSHAGHWGYMNDVRQFNKVYYACRLFGGVVKDYSTVCEGCVAEGKSNYFVLPVRSADGARKGLLLVDFRNTDQVIEVAVSGCGVVKRVSATVLDHTRDNFPCGCDYVDGRIRLVKADKYSAAFFIEIN